MEENNAYGDSSTGGAQNGNQGNKKLQQTQDQINEVVGIMRVNVEKVLERDQKLSDLHDRADVLQQGATQFGNQASRLKKKMWWKNMKMMIIIGIICLIVLALIIVWAVPKSDDKSQPTAAPPVTAAPSVNTNTNITPKP